MRARVLGIAVVVSVVVTLSGLTGTFGAAEPVKNPDTLVVLTYVDPVSLDPGYAYDTSSDGIIWPGIYETLITYDGSVLSRYVPRLATDVPSLANGLISEDGLTYTFPIRQGVHFHDGTVMTPADVRYSMLRFMLQDRDGGPSWLLLAPLLGTDSTRDSKGAVAVKYDDAAKAVTVEGQNVVFHLKRPDAAFLSILAAWSFVLPQQWAAAHGDWDGTAATWAKYNNPKIQDRYEFDHTNGTGPFSLQTWDRQSKELILVRNDRYWRAPATLARVVIRTVTEFATRRLALQQGDADVIAVDRPDQTQVAGMEGVTVQDGFPTLLLQAFQFNQKIDATANPDVGSGKLDGNGIPPDFFSDVHVRRAFASAFDYGTFIRDAYRGKALQPNGPIIQGLLGYDAALPTYSFDRQKAVAEFHAAWGGKLWDTGFTFTEMFNTGNTSRQVAAQIVKDVVESLNPKFHVGVRSVQWSTFLQVAGQHKGTMYAIAWSADYPDPDDFAQPFLASDGSYPKRNGFADPRLDQLVQEGITTADPVRRADVYRRLTRMTYEDAPAIFEAQPTAFVVMRSWVHGWYYNAVLPPLANVGFDFYSMRKE
jgi:peptide/nickel transport system substrate-binding protein